ncbi:hypothetical protein DUI87_16136 [Hirundo rustica rustica]|uniref:Uncharacterized protein n=1 Tax=Hirundo rustica rustica TaxID=333673 RepID=A0A3M0K0J7_HIRRU|nr:hypothetical protein DUI87_16136 [Hirundo rustica rustica]
MLQRQFPTASSPWSLPALLGLWPLEQKSRLMQTYSPSAKKELMCELLQELNPNKLMGPDIMPLRAFKRAGYRYGCTFHNLGELWRSGDISEGSKKANVTPISKKVLKDDPGSYRLISLTSDPGKIMEQILLGCYHKSDEACDREKGAGIHEGQMVIAKPAHRLQHIHCLG